jgi:hypothetical protein
MNDLPETLSLLRAHAEDMSNPPEIDSALSVRHQIANLNFDMKCRGGCILERQEPEDTPYGRLAAGTHCSKCGTFFRDEFQPEVRDKSGEGKIGNAYAMLHDAEEDGHYRIMIGGVKHVFPPGSVITLTNEGYTINGGEMIKSPGWANAKITAEEHAEFGYSVGPISGRTETAG